MLHVPTLPADAPRDEVHGVLLKHGAVIVEDFLSSDLVRTLNADLDGLINAADPSMKHVNPKLTSFFGPYVRHVSGLSGKSKAFAEDVMCHPIMLDLADRVLVPNCAEYILNIGHDMERGPGAERQLLHRDQGAWKHFSNIKSPDLDIQVASVVALRKFTKENGATALVPGSHTWPLDRQPNEDEIAYAEMMAGSAVIYLGRTIHAGGCPSSGDLRQAGVFGSGDFLAPTG